MDYLYIRETPWHNMGYSPAPESPPATTEDLVKAAKLDWEVEAHFEQRIDGRNRRVCDGRPDRLRQLQSRQRL